jgi:hypothetical protein
MWQFGYSSNKHVANLIKKGGLEMTVTRHKHSRGFSNQEKCEECGVLLCMALTQNQDTLCTLERGHTGPHFNAHKGKKWEAAAA